MPDVAIISASYGGYDFVKRTPAQEGLDVEWVLVTDDLEQKAEYDFLNKNPDYEYGTARWRVVYDPCEGETRFRAAKRAKFRPWEYTDAPASIWIDGSVVITTSTFASEMMEFANPVAAFDHEGRDCIYDEAVASLLLAKYKDEPIVDQAAYYFLAGHPEHWGLWLTTVLARKHTDAVKKMSQRWEYETTMWSTQDQVSFPFALRDAGLRPRNIKPNLGLHKSLYMQFSDKHNHANRRIGI